MGVAAIQHPGQRYGRPRPRPPVANLPDLVEREVEFPQKITYRIECGKHVERLRSRSAIII